MHKEDGYIFLADGLHLGWKAVFERYTGYLHVLPRLLAAIALQFPAAAYPIVVGLLVALVRVWMACLTYWVLRSRGIPVRMSAAMASLFVIVPVGSHEVLGNLTNLRWFGDAMLVVLFVGRLSGARAFAGALTAALCALSDPLAITLAPFALVALWRGRGPARAVPASALAAAGLHFAMLESTARSSFLGAWLSMPFELLSQLLVRGVMASQYGVIGTQVMSKLMAFPLVLVAAIVPLYLLWRGGDRLVAQFFGAGLYLLLGALAFAEPSLHVVDKWWAVGQPSRYSLAPAVLLGMAGMRAGGRLLAGSGHRIAVLAAVAFVGAFGMSLRGDHRNVDGTDWPTTVEQAQQACQFGGGDKVTVEFTPQTAEKQWSSALPCDWLVDRT